MAGASQAAETLWDMSSEQLGEVRITHIATGTPTTLDKSVATVTVITEEDIAAIGATELDQVLETVPGLHVSRSDQMLFPKYIFRGITSTLNAEALLLINGIPQTTLAFGNRNNIWAGMPVKAIARIEVIRGPGSALYGADAFSGVINIITKSRSDIDGTLAGGRVGSFNRRDAWAMHGGTYNDTDIAFTLEYSDVDSYDNRVEADAQTGLDALFGSDVSNAPGQMNTGRKMLESHLQVESGDLRFLADYQGRFDVGTGPGIAQALDPQGGFRSDRVNTALTHEWDDVAPDWSLTSQVSGYWGTQDPSETNRLFPRGAFGGAFPDGFIGNPGYKEWHLRAQSIGEYNGWNEHRFRIGAGAFVGRIYQVTETKNFMPDFSPRPGGLESVADTDEVWLPEKGRNSQFLFVQDEWQFARNWQLTSGVRYDHYSDFGGTVNPRLALIWATTDTVTTKLLYGRAFRAPTVQELFVTSNPVLEGNRDLEPETIDTFELALRNHPSPRLHYGVNLFYYEIDDYIVYEETGVIAPNGLAARKAQNAGKRKGHGTEFELEYEPVADLTLIANYAFQKSTDERTSHSVGEAPNHEAYARSEWRFLPRWQLDTQVTWVGEQDRVKGDNREPVDDYTKFDITVRNQNSFKGWSFAASVRNLFDEDVREPSPGPNPGIPGDYPMPGRWLYAEAQYQF